MYASVFFQWRLDNPEAKFTIIDSEFLSLYVGKSFHAIKLINGSSFFSDFITSFYLKRFVTNASA